MEEHKHVERREDPYLQYLADFKPRPGFSALDEAWAVMNGSGGKKFKRIHHYFEGNTHQGHCHERRRDPQEILCIHAAAGMDSLGCVRHAWVDDKRLIGFAGFVMENQEGGRVFLYTRGNILLHIDGLDKKVKTGMKVFAEAPNKFNLSGIGLEMGCVRFIEDVYKGIASVAFRAYDDPFPLDNHVSPSLRERSVSAAPPREK